MGKDGADRTTVATRELAGASVWERDLYRHLTDHIEHERALLKDYVAAARTTESEALAYLVNLLIGDELHHHNLFKQLAESLKSSARVERTPPRIPRIDFQRGDSGEVVELTRQLLHREETDARELKRLQGQLADVKDTTLWGLLVELMQRDTEKHIAILRFVLDHAAVDAEPPPRR